MTTSEQTGSPGADCCNAWCRWDTADHWGRDRVLLTCWGDGKAVSPVQEGWDTLEWVHAKCQAGTSPRQGLEGDLCPWRCSEVMGGAGQPPSRDQTTLFQPPSPTTPSDSTERYPQPGTGQPHTQPQPALPTGLPEPAAPRPATLCPACTSWAGS